MTKVYSDILDRMENNTFKRQVEEWTRAGRIGRNQQICEMKYFVFHE